jgi:hypothetical protein
MSALAFLSIERVPLGRAPRQPPTNEERVRAFRAFQPVTFASGYRLPPTQFRAPRSPHEIYAAEACADAAPSTDDWSPEA